MEGVDLKGQIFPFLLFNERADRLDGLDTPFLDECGTTLCETARGDRGLRGTWVDKIENSIRGHDAGKRLRGSDVMGPPLSMNAPGGSFGGRECCTVYRCGPKRALAIRPIAGLDGVEEEEGLEMPDHKMSQHRDPIGHAGNGAEGGGCWWQLSVCFYVYHLSRCRGVKPTENQKSFIDI